MYITLATRNICVSFMFKFTKNVIDGHRILKHCFFILKISATLS